MSNIQTYKKILKTLQQAVLPSSLGHYETAKKTNKKYDSLLQFSLPKEAKRNCKSA